MMSDNPIQGLMGTSMEKIREMVDANTVVGDPILTPDGTTIIPVSKISFGFAAGGSEFSGKQQKNPFGGGSGAGVSVQPLAFLVVSKGDVQILQMNNQENTANRIVDAVPGLIQQVSNMFKKPKQDQQGQEQA